MITARHRAASAVVNGNLYVIGGRVDVNEIYDSEKNT
jgi:Kelch motif protein